MISKILCFHLLCLGLAQVNEYAQAAEHRETNEDGKVAENSTRSDGEENEKRKKHDDEQPFIHETHENNYTESYGKNSDSEEGSIIYDREWGKDYYEPLLTHGDHSAEKNVEDDEHHYEQLFSPQNHSAGSEVEDHSERGDMINGKQLDRDYSQPLFIHIYQPADSDQEKDGSAGSDVKDQRKRGQHRDEGLLIPQGHFAGGDVGGASGRSSMTDGKQLDRDYYHPLLIDSHHSAESATDEEHSAESDVEEEHTTRGDIEYDEQWERHYYEPLLSHFA